MLCLLCPVQSLKIAAFKSSHLLCTRWYLQSLLIYLSIIPIGDFMILCSANYFNLYLPSSNFRLHVSFKTVMFCQWWNENWFLKENVHIKVFGSLNELSRMVEIWLTEHTEDQGEGGSSISTKDKGEKTFLEQGSLNKCSSLLRLETIM